MLEVAGPAIRKLHDEAVAARKMIATTPTAIDAWAESRFYIPGSSEPIRLAEHQRAVLRLMFTRTPQGQLPYRTCIYSTPKKSGKCVQADQRILLADGSWRRAGDLIGCAVSLPAYDQKRGVIVPSVLSWITDNGSRPCVEVITRLGRRLVVTDNHPFLRYSGWEEAANLKPGQSIAVPLELPDQATDALTFDEASLLALFIADGGLTGGGVNFTKWRGPLREEFIRIVESMGVEVRTIDDGHTLVPTTGNRGGKSNPVTDFIRAHGLYNHGAATKFVPDAVFRSSNKVIARFLNRLYACDGWVTGQSVGYSSNSRRLAEDVHRLLMRFGIHAKLYRRPCPECRKTNWHWFVDFGDRESVLAFADRIGMLGKEPVLENAVAMARARHAKRARQVDVFERSIWEELAETDLAVKQTWAARRDVVRKRAAKHGLAALVKLADASVGWDVVKAVTHLGMMPTVAIEVPGYETFVTDTINHNTTAAGIVLRWYAETQGRHSELYAVGNDLEQAKSRSFATVRTSIELSPGYDPRRDRLPGIWQLQQLTFRNLKNFSTIKALAVDARGEAGGAPAISVFTELWGFTETEALRFWDELTPVPTIPDSMRLVETYAGYEQESTLLKSLYTTGLEGRQLSVGELASRTNTSPLAWHEAQHPDDPVPVWENAKASQLTYWDTGTNARRMPWQQGDDGAAYYREQESSLTPLAFRRLHMNEWVSVESAFIPPELWDACLDPEILPLAPGDKMPIVVGVDAATTFDCYAVVAVSRHPDPAKHDHVAVRAVKVFDPIVEGGAVDYDKAEQFLRDVCKENNVVQICFDPFQLESVMQRLRKDSVAWCEPFSQQQDRLKADRQLYDLIVTRRLHHTGNTLLRDHALNAGARLQRSEDSTLRLVKIAPHRKIDAVVALSMAAARCLYLTI